MANVENSLDAFWLDRQRFVLVGCGVDLVERTSSERFSAKFSHTGAFGKSHYLVGVEGFDKEPLNKQCYEMVVTYQGKEDYCYWSGYVAPLPLLPGESRCDRFGEWPQDTPMFKLVNVKASRPITARLWRQKYSNWQVLR